MRTVGIFYDGSVYTRRWLWTLLWAKDEIKKLGYKIEFVVFSQKLSDRDARRLENGTFETVLIAQHAGFRKLPIQQKSKFLKYVKQYCRNLIWLDTSDSTGTCNFEVLPYVDKYLKKQLANDLSVYKQPLYGGRLHSDYFHRKFGVLDPDVEKDIMAPLDDRSIDKIGLSWNVGIGNIESHGLVHNIFNRFLFPYIPVKTNLYHFISPLMGERAIDVEFQGSFTSLGVGWQRNTASTMLSKRSDLRVPSMEKRGSYKAYFRELTQSKCTLGLFSFGEICYRDFEAFIAGSVLIKPDMSHMRTWPDWYIKDETYISVAWDLSDLEQKIDQVIGDWIHYRQVAAAAQKRYQYFVGPAGKKEFACRFVDIVT